MVGIGRQLLPQDRQMRMKIGGKKRAINVNLRISSCIFINKKDEKSFNSPSPPLKDIVLFRLSLKVLKRVY